MTAVTSKVVTTVAEDWQIKHMVLHHNYRHWEVHRECWQPQMSTSKYNEISKIGPTRATARKKEDKVIIIIIIP